MTARRGVVGELCFAAEGMAGTAASSSLRRLSSLMDQAPAGRLFGAISTLTEMSAKATRALEQGHDAMQVGDDHQATLKLARALTLMDDMAMVSQAPSTSQVEPSYLKARR